MITTLSLAVTGFLLASTKTEAQNPTWELYGWCNKKQYKPVGGGDWFDLALAHRGSQNDRRLQTGVFADEGHAIKDVYYNSYEMNNPDHYN